MENGAYLSCLVNKPTNFEVVTRNIGQELLVVEMVQVNLNVIVLEASKWVNLLWFEKFDSLQFWFIHPNEKTFIPDTMVRSFSEK